MATDASPRTSTITSSSTSINGFSPLKNIADDSASESTIIAPASCSQQSSASLSEIRLADNADSTQLIEELRNSQASNGISSLVSSVGNTGCAIPYGTRSRNRSSNSRPNYAEDWEIDTDYEVVTVGNNRKLTRALETENSSETGKSSGNSRKTTQSDTESCLQNQNNVHDPIPGISIFSAHPVSTGSGATAKKRKAANQANQNPLLNTQAQVISNHSTNRKTSAGSRIAVGFRETNMMSFEKCGGKVTENNLLADDDTVLQINGNLSLGLFPSSSRVDLP